MFQSLKKYRLRRNLKAYIRKLGPALASRYSRSEFYSIGQVRTTIQYLELPREYDHVGYALYLEETAFNEVYHNSLEKINYKTEREKIISLRFNRNTNSHATEALSFGHYSMNTSSSFDDCDGGSD